MIFVAVGTQFPFDRMIKVVDKWASSMNIKDVTAQIGEGVYRPSFCKYHKYMDHKDFHEHQIAADLLIGHAGMGTIISAMELGKPVIIMPRKSSLGEHRNDHQLATANYFKNKPSVYVAMDEKELLELLINYKKLLGEVEKISAVASAELIGYVKNFIYS